MIFLLMSAFILTVGTGYYVSSQFLRTEFRTMETVSFPAVDALGQARERALSLWGERENEEQIQRSFLELEAALISYGNLSVHRGANPLALQLRRTMLELQETFQEMELSSYLETVTTFNRYVSEAVELENSTLVERTGEASLLLSRFSYISLLLLMFAVLVCLIPGWWLTDRISTALGETQKVAEEVAHGNLELRLPEGRKDELSKMAQAFNRMVDTIREADEEITREVEERIRAEEKASIAAKAKSDFLAQVSHEFRTPLNGILGYSQLLSMDPGLSPANLEVVKSLEKSGESLLELINDVLDLSKIDANKMSLQKTRFYLGDFLTSLKQSVEEQVRRKGLVFDLHLDENLPEDVLADPIRLRQVLVNLLGNSLKFTDVGHIGLSLTPVKEGIRFAVSDTGIGIPEDQLDVILQPFRQVNQQGRKNHGTGLGLSISNRLLEIMGARLAIKSQAGEGSTFWFDLPQPDLHSRRLVQSPATITGYRGGTRKILVGEGGGEITGTLLPLLQQIGFETLHVEEPEAFVTSCALFQPDALVLDLYFAGNDGIKIMKEAQTSLYEKGGGALPCVIFFSDHRAADDRERCLRAGGNGYLGTPLRFNDLLALLKEALDLTWREGGEETLSKNSDEQVLEEPVEHFPGEDELSSLLSLVRTGNTRQVRIHLREILQKNPQTESFVNRILALSSTYRMNDIQRELEEHLNLSNPE